MAKTTANLGMDTLNHKSVIDKLRCDYLSDVCIGRRITLLRSIFVTIRGLSAVSPGLPLTN